MTGFSPSFGTALRAELQARVRATGRPAWRRPRWIVVFIAVLAAALLGGTAAATAGFRVTPGASVTVPLGHAVVEEHRGSATVDLGTAPAGATDIAIEFWCLSAGTYEFGDGSRVLCRSADVNARSGSTVPLVLGERSESVPLEPGAHRVSVTASPDASWRISAAYVNSSTTPWAINPHGQTYGAQNSHGTPDLIAVQTTDGRNGYAFSQQVADADGTTAAQGFTSPQQALDWQARMAGKTIHVPVYLSDGSTRIGSFDLSYPDSPGPTK